MAVNATVCGAGPDGLSADAVTVGAALLRGSTVTVTSSLAVLPSGSVTVTVAVYEPGCVNV